jgi:hypothetical protein
MNAEAKRAPARPWRGVVRRLPWAALLLLACRAPPGPRPPPAATTPPAIQGVELYQVDATQSQLLLRVYREGPLAALGHNHVIVARGLEGSLHWHPDPARCSLTLRFPVEALSVDEPVLRAAAGADFATTVDEAARSGTRANMLGPRLLDAQHYPQITLVSERVTGTATEPRIALRVYVAGHDAQLEVPAHVARDADGIRASGDLELRQTTLGLTPFAVMFGALRVADALQVHFDIRARPAVVAAGGRTP